MADIESIIAKIELGRKIAQIALACPACRGLVNKEVKEFKNSPLLAHHDVIKGERR